MSTIGESISRVRGSVKAVDADSFLTDRFIHSMIIKYAKMYIKNPSFYGSRINFGSLYKRIPCIDLEDSSPVAACCNVETDCVYKKTAIKLPTILEGPGGPLLRGVGSVDGSTEAYMTTPQEYIQMSITSGFKYNTKKYFWIIDGYLYFPNVKWSQISLEGIFEGDLTGYGCDDECSRVQDQGISIPPDLLAQIEKHVIEDLANSQQLNLDMNPSDKQSLIRK
jgi:hypothetical protein